jgi:import inner membrane translocase subunit TIM44
MYISQSIVYANPQRRPSFISQLVDNIKQEMAKNKEMKDNIKKFREEAEKLEQSDALKKARYVGRQRFELFRC